MKNTYKYSKEKLIKQFEKEEKMKFLFFWGHRQKNKNLIDKSCLSQWFESKFIVNEIVYLTAEHWMMAKKAQLFKDDKIYQKTLTAKTPGEAKKLGRQVSNFDPVVWDTHKYEFVVNGNVAKFSQNVALKEFLLKTNNRILVEASPVDKIWGIGMAQDNPKSNYPYLWRGENLLGFALMEARDMLQ